MMVFQACFVRPLAGCVTDCLGTDGHSAISKHRNLTNIYFPSYSKEKYSYIQGEHNLLRITFGIELLKKTQYSMNCHKKM